MKNLPALVASIAVAASPLVAVHAQVTDDRRSETVRFADLDLNNHEGAVTLLRRLRSAAADVCATGADGAGYAAVPLYQRCVDHALTDAVLAVDQPGFTAYAQARGVAASPGRGSQAH